MNKIVLVAVFLINTYLLSAIDINDIMIKQGSKEVIKNIKLKLENKYFWKNRLSNKDVSFGLYPKKKYLIVASKTKKAINIYDVYNDVKHIDTIKALFGKIDGDKKVEGDLKTPIGVYDFTSRLSKLTKLEDRFGPLALTSNYPNLIDKNIFKKTGYGIWLHGKPMNNTTKIDTKGCIAIDNKKLLATNKKIDYKNTVLIISDNEVAKSNRLEISTILSNLYSWKHAWEDNNFHKYISYYNPKFKRFNNKSLSSFSKFKKNIFKRKNSKQIIFKDIEIIPYYFGNKDKYFRIRFFEDYRSKKFDFKGNKELFVSLHNDKISILVEK